MNDRHRADAGVVFVVAPRDTFIGLEVGRKTCDEVEEAVRWGHFFSRPLKGGLMGIAATKRRSTVTGIDIGRYANGKLVQEWLSHDMLGMLQQLARVISNRYTNIRPRPLIDVCQMTPGQIERVR